MKHKRKRRGLGLLAAVSITLATIGISVALVGPANAGGDTPHKWYVCKYVGKPGVDERLQTGQNPIFVDRHSIAEDPVTVGSYFNDKQGRSFVLSGPFKHKLDPEPGVDQCPAPQGPTEDASFTENVAPATCDTGQVLTFTGVNVTFNEDSPITGPQTGVDVTATPEDGHAWSDSEGDTATRTVFEGDLSGPDESLCPQAGLASASVDVTPATCKADGSATITLEHAALQGTDGDLSGVLSQEVGDHVADVFSDNGFVFDQETQSDSLKIPYTIEGQKSCGPHHPPKPPHHHPHNPSHHNTPAPPNPGTPTVVDSGL